MKVKQGLLVVSLIFLQISQVISQVGVIQVSGMVMEKKGDKNQGVEGVELWVSSEKEKPIKMLTEKDGSFSFKALKNQSNIRIDIPPSKFAVLNSRDGSIELSKAQFSIEVIITVVSQESNAELYQEIRNLSKKVKHLNLSNNRLNALYESMRDSILHLNAQKNNLMADLAASKAELGRSEKKNSEVLIKVEELQAELASREKENRILKKALYEALEEKYLRQQSLFQDISENFKKYLLSIKDLSDQAPKMMTYVKSNNYYSYREVFRSYNDIYTQIEAQYLPQIKGVNRYWQEKTLSKELEAAYSYLMDTVHKEQLLLPFNELNGYLRLSKTRKVKSKAEEIKLNLPPIIKELEERISQFLEKLNETT